MSEKIVHVDVAKQAAPEPPELTFTEHDARVVRFIELARHFAAEKDMATTAFYYEAAFAEAKDLKTPVERLACGEACAFKAETAALQNMHGTAVDWYFRALTADPLSDELKTLYAKSVDKARAHADEVLCKLEEEIRNEI